MKKISVIVLFFVLFVSVSIAQEQVKFKNCHKNYNIKIQQEMGADFKQVKFRIAGVSTQEQANTLLEQIKSSFEIKRARIKPDGSFSAYMKKEVNADELRIVLIKQGYDYDFETVKLVDKALIESLKKNKK